MGAPQIQYAIPAGGGVPVGVSGTGTVSRLAKFTAATTIADSGISDDGTTVSFVSRNLSSTAAQTWTLASSTSALNIASGLLNLDTTNTLVRVVDSISTPTTYAFVNGGNSDTIPFVSSMNNATLASATYGWGFINRSTDGNLQIARRAASTSWTATITIERATGNVGVNTSGPGARFQVNDAGWPASTTATSRNVYTGTITAGYGGSIGLGGYYTGTTETTFAFIVGGKDNATAGDFGGHLQFWTRPNGGSYAERARIDSSGNVGIGTASPVAYASYTSLTIGDNAANKTGLLKLRSTYNTGNGAELLQLTTGVIYLNPNSAVLGMALDPNNKYLDLTQTSGYGLKLPATPGNADAQTLDCYSEPTWTPTDASGAGLTLTVNRATYTKVGRTVTATLDVQYPVTANASAAKINLPESTSTQNIGAVVVGFCSVTAAGLAGIIENGKLDFYYGSPSAAVPNSALSNARIVLSVSFNV